MYTYNLKLNLILLGFTFPHLNLMDYFNGNVNSSLDNELLNAFFKKNNGKIYTKESTTFFLFKYNPSNFLNIYENNQPIDITKINFNVKTDIEDQQSFDFMNIKNNQQLYLKASIFKEKTVNLQLQTLEPIKDIFINVRHLSFKKIKNINFIEKNNTNFFKKFKPFLLDELFDGIGGKTILITLNQKHNYTFDAETLLNEKNTPLVNYIFENKNSEEFNREIDFNIIPSNVIMDISFKLNSVHSPFLKNTCYYNE